VLPLQQFPPPFRRYGETGLTTVVLEKAALRVEVIPAITGKSGAVHIRVQLAQPENISINALRVVEETVSLRQAQVAREHHMATG